MYRIIGSDGKEYGPVDAAQMKRWLIEGRVDATTQVMAEGTAEWKALSQFPELAATIPARPSPPAMDSVAAANALNGPATGLIVTAILGFVVQAFSVLGNIFGMSQVVRRAGPEVALNFFTGGIGFAFNMIGVGIGVVILLGALKMKKLESHSWGMAASILALIPCISPCCLVGIPIGIWSLVVLSKPEVKRAFPQNRGGL